MQVLGLTGSLKQLVEARRDTIEKLRASADYLDSIWLRSGLSVIFINFYIPVVPEEFLNYCYPDSLCSFSYMKKLHSIGNLFL
jgi:hypothetical protein